MNKGISNLRTRFFTRITNAGLTESQCEAIKNIENLTKCVNGLEEVTVEELLDQVRMYDILELVHEHGKNQLILTKCYGLTVHELGNNPSAQIRQMFKTLVNTSIGAHATPMAQSIKFYLGAKEVSKMQMLIAAQPEDTLVLTNVGPDLVFSLNSLDMDQYCDQGPAFPNAVTTLAHSPLDLKHIAKQVAQGKYTDYIKAFCMDDSSTLAEVLDTWRANNLVEDLPEPIAESKEETACGVQHICPVDDDELARLLEEDEEFLAEQASEAEEQATILNGGLRRDEAFVVKVPNISKALL